MKGIIKAAIIGGVIIGLGVAIILITLAVNGWSVKKPEFDMQSYTAESEISSLNIHIGAGQVKVEFYDGDKIVVDYPVSDIFKPETSEKNGVFTFTSMPKKNHWFIGSWDIPKTTIKLPKDTVYDLDFEVNAGTVDIASGVYGKVEIEVNAGTLTLDSTTCDKLNCKLSAGECKIKKLNCPDIKAKISAGSLSINIDDKKSAYDIKASVSAGSCNVSNQTVGGDKKLEVDCSAGSINVTFNN